MKYKISLFLIGSCWIYLAFSQPIVMVLGVEDSLAIKNQVTQYLHHLDVRENIHLTVCFTEILPSSVEGMTLCLNTPTADTCQIISVRIKAHLDHTQQKLVLAHEMIHVKQFAKGELIVNSKHKVIWKGKTYWSVGGSRPSTPWEEEAYQKGKLLARRQDSFTAGRHNR